MAGPVGENALSERSESKGSHHSTHQSAPPLADRQVRSWQAQSPKRSASGRPPGSLMAGPVGEKCPELAEGPPVHLRLTWRFASGELLGSLVAGPVGENALSEPSESKGHQRYSWLAKVPELVEGSLSESCRGRLSSRLPLKRGPPRGRRLALASRTMPSSSSCPSATSFAAPTAHTTLAPRKMSMRAWVVTKRAPPPCSPPRVARSSWLTRKRVRRWLRHGRVSAN